MPIALTRLPVGRHGLPRTFVEENQRNRLIAAALEVFTTHGYAEASIAEVIAAAGVSRKTYYAHFSNKEASLLAAHDLLVDWLAAEAHHAAVGPPGWPARVVAVVGTLADRLAADRRLARLLTVEILRAGPPARDRHDAVLDRLAGRLATGRERFVAASRLPAVLEPLFVSGALASLARVLEADQDDRLPEFARELSEVLLIPYVGGPVEAHRIATSWTGSREAKRNKR